MINMHPLSYGCMQEVTNKAQEKHLGSSRMRFMRAKCNSSFSGPNGCFPNASITQGTHDNNEAIMIAVH